MQLFHPKGFILNISNMRKIPINRLNNKRKFLYNINNCIFFLFLLNKLKKVDNFLILIKNIFFIINYIRKNSLKISFNKIIYELHYYKNIYNNKIS